MPLRIKPKTMRRVYLREWREHRGLEQSQLAALIGSKDAEIISRWERGAGNMTVPGLVAVEQALNVEPGALFRPPISLNGHGSLRTILQGLPPDQLKEVIQI